MVPYVLQDHPYVAKADRRKTFTNGHYVSDFRVSKVRGQDMLSFLYPQNRSFVVLDNHFNIFKELEISPSDTSEMFNMHELNFVNDGSRALFFDDRPKHLSKKQSEAFGFINGTCFVQESTFRETDLMEDWRFVYRWSATKRIDLTESTATEGTVEERCNNTDHIVSRARVMWA